MPIYEYDCRDCKAHFDLLVRSQKESPACPQCGSTDLKKAFSVFAAKAGDGAGGSPPPAPA